MLLGTLENIVQQCDPSSCQSHKGLMQLHYEGSRVNANLIQLLALYRIDQGRYSANIDEYDVHDFLTENMLQHETLLTFQGTKIELSCTDDLCWFFDRDLISGVINNIINNACKYTKDKIRLSAHIENEQLAICIEDNGSGYPPHMLYPNTQTQAGVNFNTGSTGLGLYFASIVAALHHNKDLLGSISTSNDGIDGGGQFTIYLP